MFEFDKILTELKSHDDGWDDPYTVDFPDPCTILLGNYTGKFSRSVDIYYYIDQNTFDIHVQYYFECNNSTIKIVDECLIKIAPDGIFQSSGHSENCWFASQPSQCYIYPNNFHRIDNDDNWSVRKYCKNGSNEPNAIDFRVFDSVNPDPWRRKWYDLFESPLFNFDGSAITLVEFKKFIFDAMEYVGGNKDV